MIMEEDMVKCEECDFVFMVVYNNDGMGGWEYCPRCGYEFEGGW